MSGRRNHPGGHPWPLPDDLTDAYLAWIVMPDPPPWPVAVLIDEWVRT